MGEIDGLTDTEKKEIYMPGAKFGRKLKPGETCQVSTEHQTEDEKNN